MNILVVFLYSLIILLNENESDAVSYFKDNAPVAWNKYIGYFIEFKENIKIIHKRINGEPFFVVDYSIKKNDSCVLTQLESIRLDNGECIGSVSCIGRCYNFYLDKNSDNDKYILTRFGGFPREDFSPNHTMNYWISVPFSFHIVGPFKWRGIDHEDYVIHKANYIMNNNKKKVKVYFEHKYSEKHPLSAGLKGWAIYDPQNYWLLDEYNLDVIFKDKVNRNIYAVHEYTYDKKYNLPLIKIINAHIKSMSNNEERKIVYQFNINLGEKFADHEFTLSAYGLPEPVGLMVPRSTPRFIWFIIIAAVCVAIGAIFSILWRRRLRRVSMP